MKEGRLISCRQIKNRHGLTLAIMNNGEVRGVPEEAPANKNAILEFIPTEPPGAYRIRGIEANLHLAMDDRGRLYGEPDRTVGSTVFAEHAHVRTIIADMPSGLYAGSQSSSKIFL